MVYLDNAATTRVLPEVLDAMLPYFSENYGNASSMYDLGKKSKEAIENARQIIADMLNADPRNIYFTSGGTESNNWMVKQPQRKVNTNVVISKIEHPAILESCRAWTWLDIDYVDVDSFGSINPDGVRQKTTELTKLVSIMYANNEIGTIQPIAEVGEITHEKNVFFHVDAVQVFGHVPIDVKRLHINALSASAHKFNGPKGVGFLYCDNPNIIPFMRGGHQERGYRAGTENVPGIVGMGKAAEIARDNMRRNEFYVRNLRDRLISRVMNEISDVKLNGHEIYRLPNNANFTIRGCEGESLLILLNMDGICASSGSACTTGSSTPSHVLKAIGLTDEEAHCTVRFSLSFENTEEEIDYTVESLKRAVKTLRQR